VPATFSLDNPDLAADGIDLMRGSASLVRATAKVVVVLCEQGFAIFQESKRALSLVQRDDLMTRSPTEKGSEAMIDGWFSVLIISLILALGGLTVLLVQSYRGESLQRAEEPHLLPSHRDRHPRARIASLLHKDCSAHQ
jgi:hypothetical protein